MPRLGGKVGFECSVCGRLGRAALTVSLSTYVCASPVLDKGCRSQSEKRRSAVGCWLASPWSLFSLTLKSPRWLPRSFAVPSTWLLPPRFSPLGFPLRVPSTSPPPLVSLTVDTLTANQLGQGETCRPSQSGLTELKSVPLASLSVQRSTVRPAPESVSIGLAKDQRAG